MRVWPYLVGLSLSPSNSVLITCTGIYPQGRKITTLSTGRSGRPTPISINVLIDNLSARSGSCIPFAAINTDSPLPTKVGFIPGWKTVLGYHSVGSRRGFRGGVGKQYGKRRRVGRRFGGVGTDWVVFVVIDESTGGVSIVEDSVLQSSSLVCYLITCLAGMLYSSTGSRDASR